MSDHEYLVRDGISVGYIAEQTIFESHIFARTGERRSFDQRVFQMTPTGSRLMVVREKAPGEFGDTGIVIPESVQLKNPVGAGYVVSVGDMVGQGTAPHPHGVRCDSPRDLLYKRIVFGMYSGSEFITQAYRDGGFETVFWVLTERDIWFVDWSE